MNEWFFAESMVNGQRQRGLHRLSSVESCFEVTPGQVQIEFKDGQILSTDTYDLEGFSSLILGLDISDHD